MPRKKLSEEFGNSNLSVNLEEDEEIVISKTETIKKQSLPKTKEVETVDLDDDADDLEDFDELPFPVGSIGHKALTQEEGLNDFDDTTCTIKVIRKPDSLNDRFKTPCHARTSYPPLRNIDLTMSEMDIEQLVNQQCGGGHYLLQICIGNKFYPAWSVSFPDLPEQPAPSSTIPPNSAIPAEKDEMSELLKKVMLKNFEKLIAGPTAENDEVKKLREEIEKMRQEREREKLEYLQKQIEELRANPAQTSDLALVMQLAKENPESPLLDKLVDYALPSKDEGGGIVDLAKYALTHQDEVKGLLGGLLGVFLPAVMPAQTAPIKADPRAIFKKPPPASPPSSAAPEVAQQIVIPPAATKFERKTRKASDTAENSEVEK